MSILKIGKRTRQHMEIGRYYALVVMLIVSLIICASDFNVYALDIRVFIHIHYTLNRPLFRVHICIYKC